MINFLVDVLPLQDAEKTDGEIAEAIRSRGVTKKPIDRAELLHLLNMRGMLRKIISNNADEKWEGTVLNMQSAILADGTPEQIAGIRLWFSHVTNPSNSKWDTTLPEFSAAFWQMAQTFAGQDGMPTEEDFQAIANLGGGWLYDSIDETDIAASREQHARQEAFHSVRIQASAFISKANAARAAAKAMYDGGATPSQILAAGEAELA